MKQSMIRYKTKPEKTEENERLIKDVFRELHAKSPKGIRYLALKLDDGTFVHFVAGPAEGTNPVTELAAFRSFQAGIRDRCIEPPFSAGATIVGNYRMLDE